jgi:DNA-binding XRE family transcriptional regulator
MRHPFLRNSFRRDACGTEVPINHIVGFSMARFSDSPRAQNLRPSANLINAMKKMSSSVVPCETMKVMREAVGWTQSETAFFLGISKKAIESYEQGWRSPPHTVCKQMLALIALQKGYPRGFKRCWEIMRCSPAVRDSCFCARKLDGHFCWFTCSANKHQCMEGGAEQLDCCIHCPVVKQILKSDASPARLKKPAARAVRSRKAVASQSPAPA